MSGRLLDYAAASFLRPKGVRCAGCGAEPAESAELWLAGALTLCPRCVAVVYRDLAGPIARGFAELATSPRPVPEGFELGTSRQMKVLVRCADGSVEGHRGFVLAVSKYPSTQRKAAIVLAATASEPDWCWGRLYLVEDQVAGQHPYAVREVTAVPNTPEWSLTEAIAQDLVGWEEPE